MANYITLGFNIFCIALILFGMFWGLIRGLKKTVSRFVFLLILGIILIFVTIPITNLLLKIPVKTSFVGEDGEIVKKVPIIELLSILMEGIIGKDFASKYPEFNQLLVSLPLTLVYVIVFVVLFWLLKLLLLPLNSLINRLIFGGKRRKNAGELGFSAYEEYPNSDSSLQPLMDIYNAEGTPEPIDENKLKNNTMNLAKTDSTKIEKTKKEKQDKKDKQKSKKKDKEDKPKKYRLLGCVVGAFVGIVLIFYTMVPFYGIINIADSIKNTKINNLTEEPTTINELTDGLLVDIVKGYDLSALGRISEVLAVEKLGVATFDHLTTVSVKDNDIKLREDIDAIVTTVVKVDTLVGLYKTASDNGLENITQEQLTKLINSTDEIIKACSEIKFANAMSDYILPLTYEILKTNDIQIVENNYLNTLIIEMISDLVEESGINVFTELRSLVDIAKYINNQGLLYPIVTNNTSDILTVIDNLDEDFGTQLSNKLFAIKAVDTVFPQILNIGLEFFDNATNFGYVENTATKEELKTSMTQLITSIVETAKSLSYDSSIYITDSSIIELGKVLDTFRNSKLFNIETYNNLIDYTMNQVKTMTTDIIPANFTDTFNNKILRNVGEVENWQTEMTIIYETLEILRDKENGILGEITENEDLRVGYSANFELTEGTLINLGKALDQLEKSVLLGSNSKITYNDNDYNNTTLIALFSSTLTEIYSNMDTEEPSNTTDILSIINNMKENLILSCHIQSTSSTYWEDELTAIAPLIVQIGNLTNGEDFELTSELGENLDLCAHNSVMLGNDTTLVLMEKLMAIVQDSILGENFAPYGDERLDDKIYNLLVAIRSNLLSEELYTTLQSDSEFWTKEIVCILSLKDIADKADTITSISSAMTVAEDLDKVYESRIIPTTELNATLAKVLRQLKTAETEGISGKINELIEDIATDISSSTFFDNKTKTNFWTIELGYINTLSNIKFEDEGDYKVLDNLSSIGADIDDIVFGSNDSRASYLITEYRIRDILSFVISDMTNTIANSFEEGDLKTTITSTLEEIATNLYDSTEDTQIEISSFESELGNLTKLANLDIGSDLFVYTNDQNQLQALENKLTSIGTSLDSIAYNNTTELNITSYNEELNSNIITRQMIANIISAAFSTAKITAETGTELSNTKIAFNTLIDNIRSSINSISSNDKVITWQRELSYVSTLIQLNSGEVFTIENAASDIGANIDKIAFNHKNNAFLDVVYNADNNIVGSYITKEIDDTDPNNIITTYYNSVVITRDILKSAVNSMITEFKVASPNSQEKIANELINNLSTRVSTDTFNSAIYNDYETALTDLNSVKTTMQTTADNMAEVTIDTLSDENITDIDNMLDTFERKIICGISTTRKIAVMLIKDFKVDTPTTTEEEISNEIIQNLIDQINNGEVTDYAAAFTDLKDIQKSLSDVQSLFENKGIEEFTREELVSIDQMLTSFQAKSICGVITTRRLAKLMVDNVEASLTNNGSNTIIMSTDVGTLITNLQEHYQSGIDNNSTSAETYYSTTTGEYFNPMASIYDTLASMGEI